MSVRNIGKEILDDLLDGIDKDTFWSWFEFQIYEYYSTTNGAFRDEGDDWYCDVCGEQVVEAKDCIDRDNAYEFVKEHIFKEHSSNLVMKAIKDYFNKTSLKNKPLKLERF